MQKMHAVEISYKEFINALSIDRAVGVVFFVIVTALGVYVRMPVPGSPVPITLQTLFVITSGAILGKRMGLYSQLSYLVLGVIGLPVFQSFSFGAGYLLGPTGRSYMETWSR